MNPNKVPNVLLALCTSLITFYSADGFSISAYPADVDSAILQKYGSRPVTATSCNSCHTTTAFGTEFRRSLTQLGFSGNSMSQSQVQSTVNNMSASVIQPLLPAAPAPAPTPAPVPAPAPVCVRAAPVVQISAKQTVMASVTATYTVTIKNNDSTACADSIFNMSFYAPPGSGVNFAFSNANPSIKAASSMTIKLAINSAVSSVGSSNVDVNFTVTATNSADSTMVTTAAGILTLTPSTVPTPVPVPTTTHHRHHHSRHLPDIFRHERESSGSVEIED